MAFLVSDVWMIIVWMVCSEYDPQTRAFGDAVCFLSLVSKQLCDVVASMPQLWQNLILNASSTPA